MAKFRIPSQSNSKPESPVLMFRDLKRDASIKYLWGHQEKLLDQYMSNINATDVAIELPTGSGKTLVGLLIAEYRRRALGERTVFLCPTRQLCNQVNSQAEKYGIATALLIGPQQDYDPGLFLSYQQARATAITTYSGIFNNHPKIDEPELIICDDAHSADNYISSMWTVTINKNDDFTLFQRLFEELKHVIPPHMVHVIEHADSDPLRKNTCDLVSTIAAYENYTAIKDIFIECSSRELRYPWRNIEPHLDACSIYCSAESFEIRPIISPALTHNPFANAKQRVYMSATLGENGDIERSFGLKNFAERLPIPEGWDKRGTGRRLILFPGAFSREDASEEIDILERIFDSHETKRALILVPDNRVRSELDDKLSDFCDVLAPTSIEQSIDTFVKSSDPTVLLIANRYDGIDLPGDDCHVMGIINIPSGAGLQEKYMLSKLNAVSQLRDRIRTRITQALGRCTRDESDYSVVLMFGDDLLKWCSTKTNVQGIHPELQAEIEFGLDNSMDRSMEELVELIVAFLTRSDDWQVAETAIQVERSQLSRLKDNIADILKTIALLEIQYLYKSWNGQHDKAMQLAGEITDKLAGGQDLKPYRSFWHHQAAVSAFLAWKAFNSQVFKQTAIEHLDNASSASMGVNWLPTLRSKLMSKGGEHFNEQIPLQEWFSEINKVLEEWRISGNRYEKKVAHFFNSIQDRNASSFEKGLEALGRMLGAKIYRWPEQQNGAPDGLWIFGNWHAFVFEAKTNEKLEGGIGLEDIRQANSHEQRVRADSLIPDFVPCSTILITPKHQIHKSAVIHAKNLSYLSQNDVINLFNKASQALGQVRSSASGNTEEELMYYAENIYSNARITMVDIREKLLEKKITRLPVIEG